MHIRVFLGGIILIDLSVKYLGEIERTDPFVCIVGNETKDERHSNVPKIIRTSGFYEFEQTKLKFEKSGTNLDLGEILIIFPQQKLIQRFYRPNTLGNTILLTEQCDQICTMCSQPPKRKDYLHWDLYLKAASLVPDGGILGISGGEPTLYKSELFQFLLDCLELNKHLQFNILTNAQHFEHDDITKLSKLNKNVLWGVPIYSDEPSEHDNIVGKDYAFKNLLKGFNYLLQSGSRVELRTVLLQQNYHTFPKLSKFVARYFTWIEKWAIMQLEPMGYAKIDWSLKFVDTTLSPENLEQAVFTSHASGIHTQLYNFPLCSLPENLRKYSVKSISDWKQKFLPTCETCYAKSLCCGFFEWYERQEGYSDIGPIKT